MHVKDAVFNHFLQHYRIFSISKLMHILIEHNMILEKVNTKQFAKVFV